MIGTLQLHFVGLVLLAAIMHAVWNAVVKASGDRLLTMTVVQTAGTVMGIMVAPLVAPPAPESWPYLVFSALVHNGYYAFLIFAYRAGDLSHVYPVARGSAPLAVAVFAAVFAAEVPGPVGIAGIALVSLGVMALAFAGGIPRGDTAKAVGLALATGLLIAVYTVTDGLGMRLAGAPWGYIVWLNIFTGIPILSVTLFLRGRALGRHFGRYWKRDGGGGVLAVTGYALVLLALSQGAMAHVAALRETSVLFATVIGAYTLGEGFGTRRIAAAAAIATGILILQLGG